jgi:protein tyrosine/serine phosphatase
VTVLAWEGCVNVRDLGGLPTEDGRETARGALIRADAVSELSPAGWQALVAHGVRTILDLRFHEEREADPPRELDVAVAHVPLFGAPDPEYVAELHARLAAATDPSVHFRAVYGEFLERYRDNFGAALRALADAEPGGIVVHCLAGKDRTGLVTALALRLAGVSRESIADDYAASEQAWGPRHEEWVAEAGDDVDREARRRQGLAPGDAMVDVLRDLEQRHGSVAGYLRGAGVSEDELERVRARLVG